MTYYSHDDAEVDAACKSIRAVKRRGESDPTLAHTILERSLQVDRCVQRVRIDAYQRATTEPIETTNDEDTLALWL